MNRAKLTLIEPAALRWSAGLDEATTMVQGLLRRRPQRTRPEVREYNPDEPRDEHGRWTGDGTGGYSGSKLGPKEQQAIADYMAKKGVDAGQVQANLDASFNAADAATRQAGTDWYPNANAAAAEMGAQFGASTETSAGVISALSPRTNWEANVNNSRALLAMVQNDPNVTLEQAHAVIRTQPARQLGMALDIAKGADPQATLTGPKRRSFFVNIVDPSLAGPVTIDGHMTAIMTGPAPIIQGPTSGGLKGQGSYSWFADQVRSAAARNGVQPAAFQAIVWTQRRGTPA